jgi:RHS repeat-associated protein
VTTSYTYEPFGKATSTGATSTNTAQFTGRETDATLTFYRSRYLNPLFGRFISEDGAGFAGGSPNLYAYLGDDPVNATDPSGHILPILVGLGLVCAGGAAFGAAVELTHMLGERIFGTRPLGGRKTNWGDVASSAAAGCVLNGLFEGIGSVVGRFFGPAAAEEAPAAVNGETEYTAAGRIAHKAFDYGSDFIKEYELPSGKRVDAINFKDRIVVELKPDNQRQISAGLKQLSDYIDELNREYPGDTPWTGYLVTYLR